MIKVKKKENEDMCTSCAFAEYDAEGKHCTLNPLTFCKYRNGYENECQEYCDCIVDKGKEEEHDVHSGITLDLTKISFSELKQLESMVDEELISRRNEIDRLIYDFQTSLEALLELGRVSIFYKEYNDEVKSFDDFDFYEK